MSKKMKRLSARLDKVEAKAKRWKAESQRLEAESRDQAKKLKRLRKRVDAALGPAGPDITEPGFGPSAADVGEVADVTGVVVAPAVDLDTLEAAVEESARESGPELAEGAGDDGSPDAGWTLTALRVAAQERGITDYATRTKAELLRLLAE